VSYSFGADLARRFALPDEFYFTIMDCFKHDLFWLVNRAELRHEFFFKHVYYRTIPFKKPAEWIRVADLTDGVPGILIGPIGVKRTQAFSLLKSISTRSSRFIVKIKLQDSCNTNTVYYGLHLPNVLFEIHQFMLQQSSLAPSLIRVRTQIFDLLTHWLNHYRPVFDFLHNVVVYDKKEFFMAMDDIVEKSRKMLSEIKPEQRRLLNAKDYEDENGVRKIMVSGSTVLGVFDELKEEHGYSMHDKRTAKAKTMAKRWAEELAGKGMTASRLRDLMDEIIKGWRLLAGTRIVGEKGREVMVPDIPTFEFFYAHRQQIVGKIKLAKKRTKATKKTETGAVWL